MSVNERAVRDFLEAATTGADDVLAALTEVLAVDVALHSPLGAGTGRDAVLDGLRTMHPMLAPGTWTDPVVDGDTVRASATFPPGSVLGMAVLTFRFDGDDKIADVQYQLAPGAPPPPTPVTLDDEIAAALNGALDNATPVIAAYVDRAGQPQLSLRGTTQVYSSDQLALWIRNPEGGLVAALPLNARLSFFYRDPATRANYQIQGRGHVGSDPHVRDVVFDNSPEREQAIDPDRHGVAVVVDVDRVTGRGPSGPVNMQRGS